MKEADVADKEQPKEETKVRSKKTIATVTKSKRDKLAGKRATVQSKSEQVEDETDEAPSKGNKDGES